MESPVDRRKRPRGHRGRPSVWFLSFLACVIVAGLFGAVTVSRRIVLVQALPATLALGAVLLARS